MKRVITGHDKSGKSVFVSVGEPQRVVDMGSGGELTELWATDEITNLPDHTVDPELTMESFVPGPGGIRFLIYRLAPADPNAPVPEPEAFRAQLATLHQIVPGLAESLEPDNPGMHTTDTVDYVIVLSGEADLELDDGASVHLEPGDCVVQRGTRHTWRNTGTEPFIIAGVMVGALRK